MKSKRAFSERNHGEAGWDDCVLWLLQVRDQHAGMRRFGEQQNQTQ